MISFKRPAKWLFLVIAIALVCGAGWVLSFSVPGGEMLEASAAKRFFVKDGELLSVKETLGAKKVITDKNIKILFDEKGNNLLIGKDMSEQIPYTDMPWGVKLYSLKNDGTGMKSLGNEIVQYAFLNSSGTKAYYLTLDQSFFEVDLTSLKPRLIKDKISSPSLSPDEKYFAYLKLHPKWQQGDGVVGALGLMVLNIATGEERQINNDETSFFPEWTPDGSKILYFAANPNGLMSHFIIDREGGASTQLTNANEIYASDKTIDLPSSRVSWSPDGNAIVYESDNSIWVNAFEDGHKKISNAKKIGFGKSPKWTDDGKAISVIATEAADPAKALIKMDAEGNLLK